MTPCAATPGADTLRDRVDEAIDAVRRTDIVCDRTKRAMLTALEALRHTPCHAAGGCAGRSCPRCTRRIDEILGM